MKKLIALLIVISTLLLVSCGTEPVVTTDETTTANSEITVGIYAASFRHPAIEMKSRVLLAGQTGKLYYYSKADGESYPFCFNPLCQHTYQERCPSILFNHQYASQSQVYYNKFDNRVYAARGQQIYSMSFDASDVRLECSLGERGKIEYSGFYASTDITELKAYENYLFFMYNNEITGKTQIYRYDMNKRSLKEMTSATDEWVEWFMIANGYIYVKSLNGDDSTGYTENYYTTDYDFENIHYVDTDIEPKVYDGEYFYIIKNGEMIAFNPITEEKKIIQTTIDSDAQPLILAVQDGCAYYLPFSVPGKPGFEYSKVCRTSMTGETEMIFDLPGSMINGMNFVSDGVIMFLYSLNMTDANGNSLGADSMFFIHCDIAEDGKFVNPKPIGHKADDEALVEFLSKFD